MPAQKKTKDRPTFHIEGGIHAQNVYQGDQVIYNAGQDIIKGDQNTTITNYALPTTLPSWLLLLIWLMSSAIKHKLGRNQPPNVKFIILLSKRSR